MKKIFYLLSIIGVCLLLFYCPPPGESGEGNVYSVIYESSNHDSGGVPTDPNDYQTGREVTVLGNPGNLERANYTFCGWNTKQDGSGITYTEGQHFTMGTADVTLYVVWIDSSIRTVLYNGNGNTGGSVPVDGTVYAEGDTVTVLGSGDLVTMQDGISLLFTGWNTAADGSGTDYEESDQFIIGAQNIMLYAQWSVIRATGPAGGLIFYDKGNYDNGWRYLEAAPADQGAKKWTAGIQYKVGTKSGGLGLGETNTIIITDSYQSGDCAARLCYDLVQNGFDDWFLPSSPELITMRAQLKILGGVGNFSGSYWSSTEIVSNDAYSIDFDAPSGTTTTDKGTYCKVRAVRAFCNAADPPTALVVYLGNGNDDGEPPLDPDRYGSGSTVTVRNNSGVLQRTGYSFCGWNTAADGSGTDYAEGSTFSMGSTDIVVYAKWTDVSFRVYYLSNGASGGTVPFDSTNYAEGQTVTVLGNPGNLVKSGYDFNGWNTQADGNGTNYLEGSALTMGTADVRLYARWMSPYNVGDTGPAGGIVFFDKGDYSEGWRYLEAAPVDQSAEAEWGCMGTEIPGADSSLLGDGFQNTLDIEAGCAAPGTAAEICANYNYGGYDDWHLPSATELFVMMTELYHTGGFTDGYYWSSTEDSADKAISVRYEEGVVCTEVYNFKDQLSRVRAVRAF